MIELVKDMKRKKCHDCGVEPGKIHQLGCDTERCPECGGQLISCDCFCLDDDWDLKKLKKYNREKWTGIMYEEAHLYCEKHNLWVYWEGDFKIGLVFDRGRGWVKCDKDFPGASHDLNTAMVEVMKNFKPRLKKTKK